MLRGFLQSYISSQWPDLPARFDSLNDDTLTTVLQFVGNNSYKSFGVNKRCKEVYLATKGMTKETFLFGYGPLSRITDRIERSDMENNKKLQAAVVVGVVFYNRRDVMEWVLEERNKNLLKGICAIAAKEERYDLLEEVFNGLGDWDEKGDVFEGPYLSAVRCGKLNVLKWLCTKGLSINEERCAEAAIFAGQIHILKWLREETGLKLDEMFYLLAIKNGHLHVMKWLRKEECPWHEFTFEYAATEGNLAILQWLHDEGCPWNRRVRVDALELEPVVIDWLRTNGYDN